MHEGAAAWGGKSAVGVIIRLLIISHPLLLDETLWRLHDHSNNLITGNRIMMGFLWWRKRAQCLLFPWKLRCPTSPLKNTEMIQMNIQQRPTPTCSTDTENSLLWDACLLQTVGVVLLLNTGHINDPNVTPQRKFTQEFDYLSLMCRNLFQTNVVKSPASSVLHRSPEVVRITLRCEFWEYASSRQRQRPFWRREDTLTCQSYHSSLNSCLIVCWKVVLPGSRGQRWRVSQPPCLQLQ